MVNTLWGNSRMQFDATTIVFFSLKKRDAKIASLRFSAKILYMKKIHLSFKLNQLLGRLVERLYCSSTYIKRVIVNDPKRQFKFLMKTVGRM